MNESSVMASHTGGPPDTNSMTGGSIMAPPGALNKIRVIVRVRPFLEDEVKSEELNSGVCMKVSDPNNMIE
jgi:hypothetical protein